MNSMAEESKTRALPSTRVMRSVHAHDGRSPWNHLLKVCGMKGATCAIEAALLAPVIPQTLMIGFQRLCL